MRNQNKSMIYQNYQRHLIKATVTTNLGITSPNRMIRVYGAGAMRVDVLRKLKQQSRFYLFWTIAFVLIGIACLAVNIKGWFNVLDMIILLFNLSLIAQGKLLGLYIGTFECFLYSFVCLKSQLYGEIIKMLLICVPLNIYSIINWTISLKREKQEKYNNAQKNASEEIIVTKLNKKQLTIFGAALIVCSGLSFVLLKFAIGQTNALLLSSIALAITIVGKVLTARKCMESYAIYIIGDIICLCMWVQTIAQTGFDLSQISMIAYYLACLSNDIYAYGLWKSIYRKIAVNGGVLLAKRKVNINKIIKLKRRFRNLKWNKAIDVAKNS